MNAADILSVIKELPRGRASSTRYCHDGNKHRLVKQLQCHNAMPTMVFSIIRYKTTQNASELRPVRNEPSNPSRLICMHANGVPGPVTMVTRELIVSGAHCQCHNRPHCLIGHDCRPPRRAAPLFDIFETMSQLCGRL